MNSKVVPYIPLFAGDELKEASLVFAYWIRTSLSTHTVSYQHLQDVILRYYDLMQPFRWYRFMDLFQSFDFKLSHHGRRFTKISHGWVPKSIRSENTLCADNMNIAVWELTWKGKEDAIMWTMGYIDEADIDKFDGRRQIGESDFVNEVALTINPGTYPFFVRNGIYTSCDGEKVIASCKTDDKVRFVFDFKRKKCHAFYNRDYLGVMATDLPRRIYLVASAAYQGTAVETTLFRSLRFE